MVAGTSDEVLVEFTSLTPVILFKLGDWTEDDDWELPRSGYGHRPGMTGAELCDSVRAWWTVSPVSASGYEYAIAVYRGVTLGVWKIDQTSWRPASDETCRRLGKSSRRWAFKAQPASAKIALAFVGPNGRLVPERRPNGRHLFGSGAVFAYWPA